MHVAPITVVAPLGDHCCYLGTLCEEDICLLQTKGILYLTCISFVQQNKKQSTYQAVPHCWFGHLPHSGTRASRQSWAWVTRGHHCHTVCAPATSTSFCWVAQSYFFSSTSIYLKRIKGPFSWSASWDQSWQVLCWTARAVAAPPLACPAECDTSVPGGSIAGSCETNG